MPTLYKTHQDAVINENAKPVGTGSANSDDMLTLAIRSQGQENRVKVRILFLNLKKINESKFQTNFVVNFPVG